MSALFGGMCSDVGIDSALFVCHLLVSAHACMVLCLDVFTRVFVSWVARARVASRMLSEYGMPSGCVRPRRAWDEGCRPTGGGKLVRGWRVDERVHAGACAESHWG